MQFIVAYRLSYSSKKNKKSQIILFFNVLVRQYLNEDITFGKTMMKWFVSDLNYLSNCGTCVLLRRFTARIFSILILVIPKPPLN
jgi:hypothetical protein